VLKAHLRERPLYLITDGGSLRRSGKLVQAIEAALKGGQGKVGAVQLREQIAELGPADGPEVLALCKALHPICQSAGAKLFLNVRARSIGKGVPLGELFRCIDGLHLGYGSPPIETVRKIIPGRCLIGFSAHDFDGASAAAAAGADYVSYSPVFQPLSKDSTEVRGIGGLTSAVNSLKIPVVALGGITAENFSSCLAAGAMGVAMITSILGAEDPGSAARTFADRLA